jgi:YD repeat-containing protein
MKQNVLLVLLGLLFWGTHQAAVSAVLSYNYDAAGRLTGSTYDGASRLTYQYDRNGNLVARRAGTDVIPDLAATFTGLVLPPAPSSLNLGLITLKLLPNGGFSGSVVINGKRSSFRGSFFPDGSSDSIPIGGMTLTLNLDVLADTGMITGTLTIDGEDSPIELGRAAFHARNNPFPAGLIGKFTLLLGSSGGDPVLIPQGDGYGTGSINKAGRVRSALRLAENTGFTHSAVLTAGPAATWPFFASLYKRKGFVTGTLFFDGEAAVSDLSGTLSWLKAPSTRGVHQAEFATALNLIGSKYVAPPRGRQFLQLRESGPNAELRLLGGVLPGGDLNQNLTLNGRNQWQVSEPVNALGLRLKTNKGSGLTTGSLRDGSSTFRFGGVVFQKQNLISGHVLGGTQSGILEIVSPD